jgi:two-component system, NtrC family, C4-dicarboxylate transport response regulator DctD
VTSVSIDHAARVTGPLLIFGGDAPRRAAIAAAIHARSNRGDGPFRQFCVTSDPSSQYPREADLFGHMPRAFTNTPEGRPGLLLESHGGALLIDDAAALPLDVQWQLLRLLQTAEVVRLGSSEVERSDVRVMFGTEHRLEALVERRQFRGDLFELLARCTVDVATAG